MPDNNTFDNIVFTGKFDPQEIVKGVDQMIGSMSTLEKQEQKTSAAISETEQALKEKTDQIAKLKANIAGLDKTQSDYGTSLKRLNDGLSITNKQAADLTAKLSQQKTDLTGTSAAVADMTKKYAAAGTAIQQLQQTAGKPISVALNNTEVVGQLGDLKKGIKDTFGDIDFTGFDGLKEKLLGAKDQIGQIEAVMQAAEAKLKTAVPGTKEFNNLNTVVSASRGFIAAYNGSLESLVNETNKSGAATVKNTEKQLSYRTEIRKVKLEMQALEEQGQTNTKEYNALSTQAAKLTHEYELQQQKVKILASETKGLDFGIAAVKAATAGYETFIGVQNLFGLSAESAEASQKKLLAVMVLVQGAQELYETFSQKSILVTLGQSAVTKALAATELFLAEAFGISAVAASGLSKALVFTGIGALIVGLGFLVSKIIDMRDAAAAAEKEEKRFQDTQKKGLENAAEETAKLRTLYTITQDVTLSMKDRNKAVDELQKLYPTYFGNLSNEAILAGKAADAYDRLTKSIIKRGLADAIKDEIKEIQKDILPSLQNLATADVQKAAVDQNGVAIESGGFKRLASGNLVREKINISNKEEDKQAAKDAIDRKFATDKDIVDKANAKIKKYIDLVGADALIDSYITDDKSPKKEKKKTEVLNIFEQELEKLKASLDAITKKVFTNEAIIQQEADDVYNKEAAAYAKARKKGQLTKAQEDILLDKADTLRNLTADKNIADFKEKQANFLRSIDEEITATQDEAQLKRISLISDNFERERQTIDAETTKNIDSATKNRDRTIAAVRRSAAENGLTEVDLKPQIDAINKAYGDLIDDLKLTGQQKLQKLGFDTFEKLSEEAHRVLDNANLGVSDQSLSKIKEQTDLYTQGKITYKEYQRQLTLIARSEATERFNIEKLFLEAEIARREAELKNDKSLTADQTKQLRDEITKLRQQLDDATKGNVEGTASNDQSDKDEKIQRLLSYTKAIGDLTNSVISFWQQANAAEAAALDRSITLQDRRVEAARNVAAKGNAEYLQLEEERLQQLEIKRENAARRQLAVNAALQASQVITALISGIAQGASVGGPLGALIGLTAIVGAIASGYAIAKSLQPQAPSFFVGTEDTGPGGNADNKRGFHAILHPRERVVSEEDNRQLKGISNKDLVRVVNTSRIMISENFASKPQPQLNLNAIDMATSSTSMQNVKLASLMEENNSKLENTNFLMRQNIRALKELGININVDKHGLSIAVLESIEEIEIGKKS